MLKFLLGASVALWCVSGDSPLARAGLVLVAYGLYRLVRWARL